MKRWPAWPRKLLPRRRWLRWTLGSILALVLIVVIGIVWAGMRIISMPGWSYTGPLPPMTSREQEIESDLRADIGKLSMDIGERNRVHWDRYLAAQAYIVDELTRAGCSVRVRNGWKQKADQQEVGNVEGTIEGNGGPGEEIVVIGGHYDTVFGSPGADDDGSGVAATLELARLYSRYVTAHGTRRRTIRFLGFYNEEFWGVGPWGAVGYAKGCRDRGEKIVGMMSLEMLGYYSDAPQSQRYPRPFNRCYPSTGNFIGFIANSDSRDWVREVCGDFRRSAKFPSRGVAAPSFVKDVGRSDHAAFWRQGYPALMVTDTANFRNPYYHTPGDTIDKIDFARMARVVAGLEGVLEEVAK